MSESALTLAAATRLLLAHLDPTAPLQDHQIFQMFVADNEQDLMVALKGFASAGETQDHVERLIADLHNQGILAINAALEEANRLVEAGSIQHADVGSIVLYTTAGITTIGVLVIIPLLLSARMRQLKFNKNGIEITFFKGVPKETIEIINQLAKTTPPIDQLIDRIES